MALRLASAGRVSSVESLNQAWYTPSVGPWRHMAAIWGQSYRYLQVMGSQWSFGRPLYEPIRGRGMWLCLPKGDQKVILKFIKILWRLGSLGPLDSLDNGENEIEPWDLGVSWPSWPSWPLLVQTSGMQAMRLAGTEATPLLHEVVMRGAGCCSWGKGRSGHRKGQGFMMVYEYFIDC